MDELRQMWYIGTNHSISVHGIESPTVKGDPQRPVVDVKKVAKALRYAMDHMTLAPYATGSNVNLRAYLRCVMALLAWNMAVIMFYNIALMAVANLRL